MTSNPPPHRSRPLVHGVLLALAAWPFGTLAADPVLPTAPRVVQGQARFNTSGAALTVTTGHSTAIDWRSFSIGPQASVRFDQPDAHSQVLNRVLGRDPSQILGRLSSNGEVWLVNPHGVLFGRDARVDVGGLVASSLNLNLADWAAGRRVLSAAPGQEGAAVLNAGRLRSASGGRIVLAGVGEVANDGTIDAPGGQARLLGTGYVNLADSHRPDIAVRLATVDGAVANRGTIVAPGGTIDLQAAMVNQAAVVRADAIAPGPGGSVLLQARDRLTLAAGSSTTARGSSGGRIDLVGGTQLVSGGIDAGGTRDSGGRVALAGLQIALLDGATVQAEGARGGGEVRIGAALDLAGGAEPAAQAVYVAPGAQVSADASGHGDGGRIRLWSGGGARVFGRFSARGGADGGDGGSIETSAPGLIVAPALVDTRAARGRAGQWLLDPLDIEIVEPTKIGSDTNIAGAPDFRPTGPGAKVTTPTLINALAAGNVTISTDVAGPDAGTISMVGATLNAPLPQIDLGTGTIFVERTLTLQANAGIRLDASSITSTTGRLNLRLLAGEGATDGISLVNSSIAVGGSVTMRGGGFSADASTVRAPTIDLQASRVRLGAPAVPVGAGPLPILRASGSGTSLLIRGLVDNVDSFTSESDANVLATAAGARWLLYASNPGTTALGGLSYGFKQYSAAYPAAAAENGANGVLYTLRPLLGVTSTRPLPLGKVYDGTTALTLAAADLSAIVLTGFVDGDSDASDGGGGPIGSVAYTSRRAVVAVPVEASLRNGLPPISDSSERSVYGYGFSGLGLVGTISPAPLAVTGATVADKPYDGTTAASVTSWTLGGVLAGDGVAVTAGSAAFDSARAGTAKPVRATATSLGGADVTNYTLAEPTVLTTASITPATLTYSATPVTVVAGTGWPALTGTLSGFVPGDTLASATNGTAAFTTPAGPGSAPGAYPVLGTGLIAADYQLVQSAANAHALRILPSGSREGLPPGPLPPWWTMPAVQPASGDVTVVPPPTLVGFAPLDYGRTSFRSWGQEVRSRELAMSRAFRRSLTALDADPSIARLPSCSDVGGALAGSCVVTPEIKAVLASLWTLQPTWAGAMANTPRDELFENMFWPQLIVPPMHWAMGGNVVLGDGSAYFHGSDFGASNLNNLINPINLSNLSNLLLAGAPITQTAAIAGAGGGGGVGGGGGGQGAGPGAGAAGPSSAPPAVLVAAATVPSPTVGASPGTPSGGSTGTAGPTCITPQQRISGECQRQAELDGLREALQRCGVLSRDQQPACLFSERVKFQLQQRERDAQLLTLSLQTRESRRAVLPDIRRKWALVIGVDEYPKVTVGGQTVRMPSAGHDARAVGRALRTDFGYITSELVNPTRSQVVQRLNMLAAIAQPHDSLLVFFSGYGFSVAQGEDAVWALSDADPQDGRTVLSHADLARLLELIDARQVALVSDSTLAGRLRVKPVDYDPKAAPDAAGLLGRRATVALTSGGNLPLGSVAGQGLSDFATQLLSVLRRVNTWHIGGRIFREVQAPLIQAGRPFVPQYGAASTQQHEQRGDYVFERRELEREGSTRP